MASVQSISKNPNFSSVLIDKPPVLEGKRSSEIIANHLNAMYAARKAFMEEEASEKLWRAIKGKTRVSTGIIYQPGDLVYYKCDDLNQWKSPVTVLGRENKQILVKHGGVYIRVHAWRLQHAQKSQWHQRNKTLSLKIVVMLRTKMNLFTYHDDSGIETNKEIEQVNNIPQTWK